MNDDMLIKILQKLDSIETELNENTAKKSDIDKILRILDKHTGMLDTDEIERLALSAQVDRLQDWAERSGAKTGVRISQAS